jgi:serine incorporator 1/3
MTSEPTGCNPFYASETTSWTEYVTTTVGAVFTVVSVLYASVRTGSLSHDSDDAEKNLLASTIAAQERHDPQGHKGEGTSLNTHKADGDDDDDGERVGELPVLEDELMGDDERNATSYSYTGFHLSFMLGSMFVAMLLTNWYVISGDNDSMATDMGWVSFSVKLVACCLGFAMYFWTVFAPALFPDRDFS